MRRHSWTLAVLATLTVFPLVGCGGSQGREVANAQGEVTLDGQPISNVVVSFSPESTGPDGTPGKSATGITDEQGKFQLSTYEIGDGALVGTHRVTVSMDGPNPTPPGKLPENYTVEVTPGSNNFSIELTK